MQGLLMMATSPQSSPSLLITWNPLPDNYPLPNDPVDEENHPKLAAALSDEIGNNVPERCQDVLIVSNFALCATVNCGYVC